MRRYEFVGRESFLPKAGALPPRHHVVSPASVIQWAAESRPEIEWDGTWPATFIVDLEGRLWIADRRSEHVACARVQPVLAAGELFFEPVKNGVIAARVTNLSTGYCPEPVSWPAVAQALDAAGIAHGTAYDPEFIFRRCENCATNCVVKDEDFTCPVCDRSLPEAWNFSPTPIDFRPVP